MIDDAPSPNGPNRDRDDRGRFLPGNRGGPGNPHGGRVARLRSALLGAVSEADVHEVIAALVERAKAGDVQAARLVLERVLGPSEALDLLEEVHRLHERLDSMDRGVAA